MSTAEQESAYTVLRSFRAVTNVVMMGICWLMIVSCAAWGLGFMTPILIFLPVLGQLIELRNFGRELLLLLILTALGMVIDRLFLEFGVTKMAPNDALSIHFLPPIWMGSQWANWSTIFPRALRWLAGRDIAAAVAGAILITASYWGEDRLGALIVPGGAAGAYAIIAITGAGFFVLGNRLTHLPLFQARALDA